LRIPSTFAEKCNSVRIMIAASVPAKACKSTDF
jgi:hypothetical protein